MRRSVLVKNVVTALISHKIFNRHFTNLHILVFVLFLLDFFIVSYFDLNDFSNFEQTLKV